MAEPDSELLSALSNFLERAQEEQVPDANRETIASNDNDFKQRLISCERAVNGLQE